MRITIISLILFIQAFSLHAQDSEFIFSQSTNTLKPFLSDIRSPLIKAETGFLNKLDGNYFVKNYNNKPFIESNLGVTIPFVNYHNYQDNFKIISSGYIGNNVLVDLFGPPTAAVVNTDYFMGFRTGFLKYTEHPLVKNIGVTLIPLFHESTHLGDEYSLHGYQKIPGFKRINLSHESWEMAVVLNDPDTIQGNILSFKAGLQGLWNKADGYYFTDSLEVKGTEVPKSKNNLEFFFNINWQRSNGFLCSEKWTNIFSMEVRNRTQFSYEADIPEQRTWNYNIYFGWLYNNIKSQRKPGLFLRYYNGIIPHGQLRNTSGYHFIGLSLVYY
ncbi:MAG: DUF1207 domain-containing protein [Prolixibacteraceae bacterium]|nr:DUF1207 domain-containing protein [Prolixibacteraceae bacterium]